jgi:hypothetical protein
MLQGTLTFSNAVKGLWASLRQMVAHVILQMVQEWIAHEIRKLLFSSLTKIKEVALETTSKVAAIAASKGAALAQIPAAAAVAAVNAMASVAAIPMVGWAMAPGVGAATFASAMSFMPAVAAEGGFDIPAGVFPVTQLHEREMVLPAPLAERVRDMTGGGGGGDTIHVNIGGIHALDGASVERVLLDNQGPLAKAIQRAHRDGRFKGK